MSANNYTGNVTALRFGNLKQITITESLGVGKKYAHRAVSLQQQQAFRDTSGTP